MCKLMETLFCGLVQTPLERHPPGPPPPRRRQVLKRVGQECEAHRVIYWTAARDGTLFEVGAQ